MKTLLIPFLLLSSIASSSAATLVAFSRFPDDDLTAANGIRSGTPQVNLSGFTGSVFQNYTNGERLTGGSNNGTYGSTLNGAATNDGYTRISTGNFLEFTVTNNSGSNYQLTTLFFDSTYTSASGLMTISYRIGSGTLNTIATDYPADDAATDSGGSASVNYQDNEFDVSSITVANGSSVTFRFAQTAGSFRMDNLALTGEVIPEPTSALLASLGLIPLLRRRSR